MSVQPVATAKDAVKTVYHVSSNTVCLKSCGSLYTAGSMLAAPKKRRTCPCNKNRERERDRREGGRERRPIRIGGHEPDRPRRAYVAHSTSHLHPLVSHPKMSRLVMPQARDSSAQKNVKR